MQWADLNMPLNAGYKYTDMSSGGDITINESHK